MSKRVLVLIGLFLACGGVYSQTATGTKTNFQTAESWKPETDVRADAVMVYGTLDKKGVTFEQRIQSWRDKGYRVEFMTGVAWGDYQDYFLGKWDGVKDHLKEGQRDREGREIAHGHLIPYIVPTESFIRYMQEKQIKRVSMRALLLFIWKNRNSGCGADTVKPSNPNGKNIMDSRGELNMNLLRIPTYRIN